MISDSELEVMAIDHARHEVGITLSKDGPSVKYLVDFAKLVRQRDEVEFQKERDEFRKHIRDAVAILEQDL